MEDFLSSREHIAYPPQVIICSTSVEAQGHWNSTLIGNVEMDIRS